MRDSKTLRLLIVEDSLEDEQVLCEALLEIEENRLWSNWRSSSIVPVDRLADALDCVRRESFDAILLNLSLPDSPSPLGSFLDLSACAGSTPILVLADEPDDSLANRLLRQGAQDVLVKSELECIPLARAIRYAIERQLRLDAARASTFVDQLTGVLTRDAFLKVGSYYKTLSRTELLLVSIEISADRDAREFLLIEAAEALSRNFEAPCVIGRWDGCRFGVMTAGLTETTVEALLHHALANISSAARFSVASFHSGGDLEEILNGDLHLHAKTAILAD